MLVLFDFGEVLGLPQSAADRSALATGAGLDPETFRERYWSARHAYDSGELSDADYWSGIAGRDLPPARVEHLVRLDTRSWLHLAPEVVALHAELVRAGVPTALFSNAPAAIADAIDALPELAPMRGRYFSARLRLAKPDPAAFATVLAALDHEPGEVLFVDDRPGNVDGARAVGLRALLYVGSRQLREDLAPLLTGRGAVPTARNRPR